MDKEKIKTLPKLPGIYLFKDKENNIIYIGKAKSLRDRVSSYFLDNDKDWKVKLLLEEIDDLEYIVTKSEDEASLLEAQIIQEKKPKFNVLLKDGQPFIYFLFTEFDIKRDKIPELKIVRNKKEKGTYFGPFIRKQEARKVHEFLVRNFQLIICGKKMQNGCMDYHLNLCCGSCKDDFNLQDYIFRLNLVKELLKGNYNKLTQIIKDEILKCNLTLQFERSKKLHDYLYSMTKVIEVMKTHFTENKFIKEVAYVSSEMSKQKIPATYIGKQLKEFLKIEKEPITIDCFDISHFQSRFIVGSCIRFTNGIPEKNKFRRFKIKSLETQNDYAALQEIVQRRYKNTNELPDLILIDGGKGQLNSVKTLFLNIPFISIAKKEEILFSNEFKDGIPLDIKTEEGKLLIALRDYAHHFAISYHRQRQLKNVVI